MSIIKKAAEYIHEGKVELIGLNTMKITVQVDDKLVLLKRKAGRVLDSCSCQNHARFVNENPRCAHKMAAITFLVMKSIKWN